VTEERRLRVLKRGTVVADLPVEGLVDDCPMYDLEPIQPATRIYEPAAPILSGTESDGETLLALLASPNLASRRTVFEQYDPVVGSRTVRRPEQADAAVLTLPDGSAIAVSIDGNGRRVACDPRQGAAEAVYECAANLACVGGAPLGLTNCLNFGSPEKPHVAWQLTEAVDGLAEACEALGIPVVGGNVSLYNEGPAGPIYPTPVVGIVGKLLDGMRAGRLGFLRAGDAVGLVGSFSPSRVGSELSKLLGEPAVGRLPFTTGRAIADAHAAVREAIRAGALHSVHDIAEGGLAVALAECCMAGGVGARVEVDVDLFAEAPGTAFVVSGPEETVAALGSVIGRVGGEELEIAGRLRLTVAQLMQAWDGGLARCL
jgi:phosphoribosylformylglycinamidine synthase